MVSRGFPPIAELKSIMLAMARRRAARIKALSDRVMEALGLPPTDPDDQSPFETEFMTRVDDLAAELAAIRLSDGRRDQPLLSIELFTGLVDEFVEKLRRERAANIGVNDPLIDSIAQSVRTYLTNKAAVVVSDYASDKKADPYDVWGKHVEVLMTLSVERGVIPLEIIENDESYDELIRRRYGYWAYRTALAENAKIDLAKLTDTASLNPFMSLMDATFGGDGNLPEPMKATLGQAADYLSEMTQPIIEAYVGEQVARIWPTTSR